MERASVLQRPRASAVSGGSYLTRVPTIPRWSDSLTPAVPQPSGAVEENLCSRITKPTQIAAEVRNEQLKLLTREKMEAEQKLDDATASTPFAKMSSYSYQTSR